MQRVKNKWKVTLKDGLVSVNGKDYLFNKCTGCVAFILTLHSSGSPMLSSASSSGESQTGLPRCDVLEPEIWILVNAILVHSTCLGVDRLESLNERTLVSRHDSGLAIPLLVAASRRLWTA